MPIDRRPLVTDAPPGHSPAARIEKLTRERDKLLEALHEIRVLAEQADAMHDVDYLAVIERRASAAIAAVEGETS